jgi:hypothetical protein
MTLPAHLLTALTLLACSKFRSTNTQGWHAYSHTYTHVRAHTHIHTYAHTTRTHMPLLLPHTKQLSRLLPKKTLNSHMPFTHSTGLCGAAVSSSQGTDAPILGCLWKLTAGWSGQHTAGPAVPASRIPVAATFTAPAGCTSGSGVRGLDGTKARTCTHTHKHTHTHHTHTHTHPHTHTHTPHAHTCTHACTHALCFSEGKGMVFWTERMKRII